MNEFNPYKFGAFYFTCLCVVATLVVKYISYMMGFGDLLPLFKTLLLGVVTAALFGAVFGRWIIALKPPYKHKAFWLGVLLVLVATPFYNVGLLYIFKDSHPSLFAGGTDFKHLGLVYLFLLTYGFLLVGLWVAIISGFASVHLRDKLIPQYQQFLAENEQAAKNDKSSELTKASDS